MTPTLPIIVLHVGTMKSGTTYLQSRLEQHRDRLSADGVLFPGPQWKNQLVAAGDAIRRARAGHDLRDATGQWGRLRTQLVEWSGDRAVVSAEHLSRANATQVREVVAALAPSPVRVVITVRDLGRMIPSAWQQQLKAGSDSTFASFIDAIIERDGAVSTGAGTSAADTAADETSGGQYFWKMHDAARHVRVWAGEVGAGNLAVVTVPRPGAAPDLLWQRFCTAAGLDAARYPSADADLALNPSLGSAGAELLRRLNERLGGARRAPQTTRMALSQRVQRDVVRFTIANATLAGLAGDAPARVPDAYDAWLVVRARALADDIGASGVRVVGDLAELLPDRSPPRPPSTPARSTQPLPAPAATTADAAVAAAVALLRRAVADRTADRRERRSHTILTEHVDAARRRAGVTGRGTGLGGHRPL